jgi:hypothetical protein
VADSTDGGRPDPAVLRDGYEQLRERVLAGRPDGWRLGHALLARRGMAGWIAAQTTVAAARPAGEPSAPATQPSSSSPSAQRTAAGPAGDWGQIVAVLSEMALAHAA